MESAGPPRITVVTPSFNQGEFLERTILSVLDQDYPGLEYIVVDGGSADGSLAIIQRFAPRLHWWCSEADGGQADAIAKGFSRATGDVLCWLNSDDILLPGALRVVGEYFRSHPQVEVINGAAYCIGPDDKPLARSFRSSYFTHGVRASALRLRFYGQDGIYQPATFWRHASYIQVGGIRTQFQFAMDLDLFLRLASRQTFEVVHGYLACFRIHDAAKSTKSQQVRGMEVARLRREHGVLDAPLLVRVGLYCWYRTASLFRKTLLQVRMLIGSERFPSPELHSDNVHAKI
jgi:glycosyltransferase involved in cell wall biosynthesis